jgi:hypothetical protein
MTIVTNRRLILVVAAVIAVATSTYGTWRLLNGAVPGFHFYRLYSLVMFILVVSWIVKDPAIPFSKRPSFDHAMLVWMSFPFLATYHLCLAHRWRGFLIVLGLLALMVMPALVFVVVEVFG